MKYSLIIGFWLWTGQFALAQDELLSELEKTAEPAVVYTKSTFKGTRLVTGHSLETVGKKHLDFIISHRFGALNTGYKNLFGLDEAQIRFGLEYGLTDRLMIGVGRSSYQKTYDYFVKYKLLQQSAGARWMPVSVTLFASDATNTMDSSPDALFYSNAERQTYTFQALIARKFNEKLSLQLSPTLLHRNKTESDLDRNSLFSLGMGGRYKLSRRTSLNVEYWYTPSQLKDDEGVTYFRDPKYTNALSVGFDIETGGHVFQLHFTNSRGMIEKQLIGQTTGKWNSGDVFYGFNVSRTFSFDRKARQLNN
jgi:hypothetical protein